MDILQQLEALFQQVGPAHHSAFADTDGVDAEWPQWYADYLFDELNLLLSASLTKSELIYLLVSADKERNMAAPGGEWPRYYANFFAERYL